jgi:glutathione-regulated potassium-efflux system ancillary protein KefC
MLTVVVAVSMAATPFLIFAFDRLLAPRLNTRVVPVDLPEGPANLDGAQKVIVLGYGRFGQIVTRMLRAQGLEKTLIDGDPTQIELVKRFGVKVFYGDASRLEILRAAGAETARMIVIAVAGGQKIVHIAQLIRQHFPEVIIAARATDRSHAHELMALGVEVFERETFRSALRLGERALVALGHDEAQARRLAESFEVHDLRMLEESYRFRHDRAAYLGFVRNSTEMLDAVMRGDSEAPASDAPAQPAAIDKPPGKASE